MFKKQILKVKHGKKLIGAGLLGLMLMGSMTAFAGNITDTYYDGNCGAGGFATITRSKDDYTSSYIYHKGERGANVSVYSGGVNYSENGLFYPVAAGRSAYLQNYVKESGRNDCYLHIETLSGKPYFMSGRWSPDSI